MATTAKKDPVVAKLPTIVKLLNLALEENKKQAALLEELGALLAGKPGVGDLLKEFYNYWNELWPHQGDYAFAFERDAPQLKRLFKMLGPDEVKARALRYLKERDPFYFDKRHPFALFVATINNWAGTAADTTDTPVVGCLHSPACRSDQEHTRRRQTDMAATH
jgi:hypothetical protein